MSGALEIAFEMLESHLLASKSNLKIVGVYEAPLTFASDDLPTPLAVSIAKTIQQ